MTVDLPLICTDRGQHSAVEFDTLRIADDGTFDMVPTRTAAAPWANVPGAHIVAEGEQHIAPKKTLRTVESHRSDYAGRRRWRWRCPRCGRDIPVNEETMSKIAAAAIRGKISRFDLSRLA